MKKIFCFILIFIMSICLTGCKKNESKSIYEQEIVKEKENKKEESKLGEYDIYDFAFIRKAPKSKVKHGLNKVIKIFFNENDIDENYAIAIDVKNSEIYIEPRMSALGVDSLYGTIKSNDAKNVIEILEKYNVQKWKSDYTVEDPESYVDGYGWSLWLQFEDGTVKTYLGRGDKEDVVPKNFDEFVNELSEFVNERIGDN